MAALSPATTPTARSPFVDVHRDSGNRSSVWRSPLVLTVPHPPFCVNRPSGSPASGLLFSPRDLRRLSLERCSSRIATILREAAPSLLAERVPSCCSVALAPCEGTKQRPSAPGPPIRRASSSSSTLRCVSAATVPPANRVWHYRRIGPFGLDNGSHSVGTACTAPHHDLFLRVRPYQGPKGRDRRGALFSEFGPRSGANLTPSTFSTPCPIGPDPPAPRDAAVPLAPRPHYRRILEIDPPVYFPGVGWHLVPISY